MLIRIKDIYKIYNEGKESEVRALDGVSLEIDRGEFVAIVGQSGSGKSTMMNVLGCLDIPTYGEYWLDGTDVTELSDRQLARIRNKEIGFIFQGYNLIQELDALENVTLPLIYQGLSIFEREDRAMEALERVGMAERAHHRPSEMSGGQQQRVAIARAIAPHPPHPPAHHHGRRAHRRSGLQDGPARAGNSPGAEPGGVHHHSHYPRQRHRRPGQPPGAAVRRKDCLR